MVANRNEPIRQFIVDNVEDHPSDIARLVSHEFAMSRQAANAHLQRLVAQGVLFQEGRTRARTYTLAPLDKGYYLYRLETGLTEDRAWFRDVAPHLRDLPENAVRVWHYGFTEMFNNALEHSEGSVVQVDLVRKVPYTEVTIHDNGVGIFRKIQAALDLLDERHSALELAKGKFTTDPVHHSGEGVFFTSRVFDEFAISSGGVFFAHEYGKAEDWILEQERTSSGTLVAMRLCNDTSRTPEAVFNQFTTGDDLAFTKTVVPVELARYGDDNLVSRSQAKRMLARVERFKTVILDFSDVDAIGQAFADEVFRVFPGLHPEVVLMETNTVPAVQRMIDRARSHR